MNNCDVCGEVRPTKKTLVTYPEKVGNKYHWNICANCEGLSPEEKDDIRVRNFKSYLWCVFHWAWWFLLWILVLGGLILSMAN
jgi:hypothetical protein